MAVISTRRASATSAAFRALRSRAACSTGYRYECVWANCWKCNISGPPSVTTRLLTLSVSRRAQPLPPSGGTDAKWPFAGARSPAAGTGPGTVRRASAAVIRSSGCAIDPVAVYDWQTAAGLGREAAVRATLR